MSIRARTYTSCHTSKAGAVVRILPVLGYSVPGSVELAVTYGGSARAEQRAPVSGARLAGLGGIIVVLGNQEVERAGSSHGELKENLVP